MTEFSFLDELSLIVEVSLDHLQLSLHVKLAHKKVYTDSKNKTKKSWLLHFRVCHHHYSHFIKALLPFPLGFTELRCVCQSRDAVIHTWEASLNDSGLLCSEDDENPASSSQRNVQPDEMWFQDTHNSRSHRQYENKQQSDQLNFTRDHTMNNQSCDVKINGICQFANGDVGVPRLWAGGVCKHAYLTSVGWTYHKWVWMRPLTFLLWLYTVFWQLNNWRVVWSLCRALQFCLELCQQIQAKLHSAVSVLFSIHATLVISSLGNGNMLLQLLNQLKHYKWHLRSHAGRAPPFNQGLYDSKSERTLARTKWNVIIAKLNFLLEITPKLKKLVKNLHLHKIKFFRFWTQPLCQGFAVTLLRCSE